MYVKHSALARPAVRAYVEFLLTEAPALVPSTGYHALSLGEYQESLEAIAEAAGSAG
jgi:hypothetical protein